MESRSYINNQLGYCIAMGKGTPHCPPGYRQGLGRGRHVPYDPGSARRGRGAGF